jgi:hypothetical protein
MALYSLADFVVNFENQYDFIVKQCMGYEYDATAPVDITVHVTEDEIQRERNASAEIRYSAGYLESVCAYRKLCMGLPIRDAMLMHGSVIECGGKGIAFLARSGVGKTTHTMLWKQVYGDQVRIINGDKPILRFFDRDVYAYGTPWAGKENLQINGRVKLTDICLIQRGKENAVFPIDPAQHLGVLMQQILLPADPLAAEKTLELLDRLLEVCKVWVIQCNITADAAITAHNAIIGEK